MVKEDSRQRSGVETSRTVARLQKNRNPTPNSVTSEYLVRLVIAMNKLGGVQQYFEKRFFYECMDELWG
jgi:hypothetical protein